MHYDDIDQYVDRFYREKEERQVSCGTDSAQEDLRMDQPEKLSDKSVGADRLFGCCLFSAAAFFLALFVASGLPMIVGDIQRYQQKRKAAKERILAEMRERDANTP